MPNAGYWQYMKSEKWQLIRDEVLEERGHACEVCYSDENLHVHHFTYEHFGDESLDELQVLCKSCHQDAHDAMDERAAVAKARFHERPLWKFHRIDEPAPIDDSWVSS